MVVVGSVADGPFYLYRSANEGPGRARAQLETLPPRLGEAQHQPASLPHRRALLGSAAGGHMSGAASSAVSSSSPSSASSSSFGVAGLALAVVNCCDSPCFFLLPFVLSLQIVLPSEAALFCIGRAGI